VRQERTQALCFGVPFGSNFLDDTDQPMLRVVIDAAPVGKRRSLAMLWAGLASLRAGTLRT
jgi:hypothetical protein